MFASEKVIIASVVEEYYYNSGLTRAAVENV
jgi:hypothetical protein